MKYTTIPSTIRQTPEQLENTKEWIVALRSGGFNQFKNKLFGIIPGNGIGYCCLGVACEIKGVERTDNQFNFETSWQEAYPDSYWFEQTYGFNHNRPIVNSERFEGRDKVTLQNLNDTRDFTFSEIADVIEAVFIDKKEITIEK